MTRKLPFACLSLASATACASHALAFEVVTEVEYTLSTVPTWAYAYAGASVQGFSDVTHLGHNDWNSYLVDLHNDRDREGNPRLAPVGASTGIGNQMWFSPSWSTADPLGWDTWFSKNGGLIGGTTSSASARVEGAQVSTRTEAGFAYSSGLTMGVPGYEWREARVTEAHAVATVDVPENVVTVDFNAQSTMAYTFVTYDALGDRYWNTPASLHRIANGQAAPLRDHMADPATRTALYANDLLIAYGSTGVSEFGTEFWTGDINPSGSASTFAFSGSATVALDATGELELRTDSAAEFPGDFDESFEVDATDIDLLAAAVRAGHVPEVFDPLDITTDLALTYSTGPAQSDAGLLVRTLLGTEFGDANLDRVVNLADYTILSGNFGNGGVGWAQGDFTGDGRVNLADYTVMQQNWGFGSGGNVAALPSIPEPAAAAAIAFAGGLLLRRRPRA